MKELLQSRVRFGDTDPAPFLGLRQIFGTDLPQSETFVTAVRKALESLYARGARATLKDYLKA